MKNLIVYAFLTAFFVIKGMEPEKVWREKFKKVNHPSLQTKLGYNPTLELIEDNNPEVVHGTGPTLYIHGWLGSKDASYLRRRCGDSSKIPGDVIVFNFQDASRWINLNVATTSISFPYWMPINKSNFGQEGDVTSLLCVLAELHHQDIQIPICYPHSRGGAALTKAISILNKPSEEWKEKLKTLEITDDTRSKILNSIKIAYLNTPLKNISLAIKKRCENRLFFFTYLFPFLQAFVSHQVSSFIQKKVLPRCTSYNATDTKEPIHYLNDWQKTITAVLHFQHHDTYVPNDDDITCAQLLIAANPNNTYVLMGKDGGHNYGDRTIAQIIHALNKSKGCSYQNNEDALNKGKEMLEGHKYSRENVADYIQNKNKEFTTQEPQKSFIPNILLYSSIIIATAYAVHKMRKVVSSSS